MSTRTITKGAKVTLRARKIKKGKIETLYLDWTEGGKRHYEYLKKYLYVKPEGSQKEMNEISKMEANELRNQKESRLVNGVNLSGGKVSLVAYMEKFKSLQKKGGGKRSHGTIKSYDTTVNLLKEYCGEGFTIADVTETWVSDFRSFLLNKYQPSTASVYLSRIQALVKHAIKHDKILKDDPFSRIDSIKGKDPEFEFLSFEELQKLKNTACRKDVVKRAALTSAMTGLRASDCMNLKWKQVCYSDEMGNFLDFTQQKTTQRERMPIKESVLEILGKRGDPNEPVFPGFKNNSVDNTHLREWVARAGITKVIKFHSFRHTFAIMLGNNEANLFQIKELLGHKNIGTTQRFYAKIVDTSKRDIINKLPDL
jgi:integrase